jgi:hypothetical protein
MPFARPVEEPVFRVPLLSAAAMAHVSVYISYFIYVLIPAIYFLPEKKLAADSE